MNIDKTVTEILCEILDIESADILPETYLIRDLGAESIDLMELAVAIHDRLGIEVEEDRIFLRNLRQYFAEAEASGADKAAFVAGKYPFLSMERIREILKDVGDGPVLRVKDIAAYIVSKTGA